MASLYIQEYEKLATMEGAIGVQVGQEPALTSQKVTYTSSSPSAALNSKTKFVRLLADADAHIVFNLPAATTNATDANMLLKANTPEYFGAAGDMLIEAYDGTS